MRPAGDHAGPPLPGVDRVPVAGDPPPFHDQPDERARRRGGRGALERSPAHEIIRLGQLHDATETRLEGVRRRVELVAVERHAGLEAERVAGAEPNRQPARRFDSGHEDVPQLGGAIPVDEDLEPVLTRVAGPGNEGFHPRDVPFRDPVVAQRAQVHVRVRREHVHRARALDRDQGSRQRAVVEDRLEAGQPLGERVRDDERVRRVGNDEEAGLAEAVDDEVVEDAAVGCGDHRVLGASVLERGRIGDERVGECLAGLGPFDEELAHVRQVEQACPFADRAVLLEDPAVLDRHEPAAELDQPRAKLCVPVGKRRLLDRRVDVHASASAGDGTTASRARVAAALATSARSVSNVSRLLASSNPTQRTSANSWSCPARSPPVGSIRK